jgi:predicted DNA-binding transcriptional regulator YafY
MPRGGQSVRHWRLLQFLGRPQGLAVEEAAQELGCAVRTVWRDLRVLQDTGLPIYDERDGRRGVWRIEQGFKDRLPIPLSLAEVVALVVCQDLLNPAGAGPLGPAVASVFAKVRALLTPRGLELVDRMRQAVGARALGAKLQLGTAEHLPAIQSAVAAGRALQIRYYSMSRDAETERRVDPYRLIYFNSGLYLVGYCHLRQEVRIFAVERIRALEPLEAAFRMPAVFDLEAYLRSAWGLIRGDLVTVKAVFARSVAPYIRERLWHPSQEVKELPGGRVELTLKVADTLEVRRWLLGFGAEAEVIEPPALREAIRQGAVKLVARLEPRRKPPARLPGAPRRRRQAAPSAAPGRRQVS